MDTTWKIGIYDPAYADERRHRWETTEPCDYATALRVAQLHADLLDPPGFVRLFDQTGKCMKRIDASE